MKDRVPTPGQEGRVKITPESGGAAYYAKIEMADNPTQLGDEPVKANLLPDAVATALGLTGNPQVKDALNKLKALVDGKAQFATGSYVGTGTFGINNPTVFTFQFAPKLFFVLGRMMYDGANNDNPYFVGSYSSSNAFSPLLALDAFDTTYKRFDFLGQKPYLKKSSDGKTIYIYSEDSADKQFNERRVYSSGKALTYYYAAIG